MSPCNCEGRSFPLALSIGLALAIGCAIGCGGGTTTSSQGSGQSSAASSGGSSIGTSSGAASSGNSTGSSTAVGSSTGTSTTGASTTTGTGAAGRPPDFVDGGYVFCSRQVDTDAGSGVAEWMCPPGTYFCQSPGSCAQCLSDADCANPELPTYEPSRSRCDLDSGVTGYQNFCQRCLADSDCAGNGLATMCDLNPNDAVSSIDAVGFETCADLGPGCRAGTRPAIGGCAPSSCVTDSDCADAVSSPDGLLSTYTGYSGQQAEPFCVNGQCANSPDDPQLCPSCYCILDSYCTDPKPICDLSNDHCACTDSSQCGGPWPICELPDGGGDVDDAGQPLGSCGCRTDQDCGDAGLECLMLPADNVLYGGSACLFSCNDPRFPGCANLSAATPLCDSVSSLCEACQTDQQCRTQAQGLFVGPFCRDDGVCGCQVDGDCPDHEVCGAIVAQQAGGMLGQCISPPERCTPGTCPLSSFCDLDGGACEPIAGSRVCRTDADCAYVYGGAFCESDAGSCDYCRQDADCAITGVAALGYSHCMEGTCSAQCAADQDCAGNPSGQHCIANAASVSSNHCGCLHDQDCTGNPNGSRCETDAGTCSCFDATDCPAGQSCRGFGPLRCTSYCEGDSECPAGFFCSESGCLPRCDDGGTGCQPPFVSCDRNNLEGDNGIGVLGAADPGAVWCYQCVTGDDCDPGEGCSGSSCGTYCSGKDGCHSGEVCGAVDELCHASCDAGPCPAGQICDLENGTGNGQDICYQCLSATDCPEREGCNSRTHSCGSCQGPTAAGGVSDCPPGAICSDYWSTAHNHIDPVCLQNCDVFDCPDPNDICGVFPQLTPDHKYCFGCLQDSDCGDGGARCDNSLGLTFTCQLPTAP